MTVPSRSRLFLRGADSIELFAGGRGSVTGAVANRSGLAAGKRSEVCASVRRQRRRRCAKAAGWKMGSCQPAVGPGVMSGLAE